MPDKQAPAFIITLTQRDWDMELSGWRCPALKIPGATVECVFLSGNRVDQSWYEVNHELEIIRWVRSDRPPQVTVLIKLTAELSTRELTLRWKKLAIVLPAIASIVVALIAAMLSYFLPRFQSGANANMAAPAVTCSERVQITAPVDLLRIGMQVMVEGSFQDLPKDQKIWVLVYPSGIGRYYPQNEAREKPDNTWLAPASIGVDKDSGKEFYIFAVLADRRAQEVLNQYMRQARNENDSPGMAELPRGTEICQHVKVTRK